jgi:hypothetical protein
MSWDTCPGLLPNFSCPRFAKMIGSMGPSFQTTLTVVLKNPEVQQKVQVQNFDQWLEWRRRNLATRHYTMR